MIGAEDNLDGLLANKQQLLAFRVGDIDFGLPVCRLREVVPMVAVTKLHDRDGQTDGVINYRGAVVPIVAIRAAIGLPAAAPRADAYILISEHGGEVTGWIVDGVFDVVEVSEQRIEPPTLRTPLRNLLSGIAKLDGRLLPLLDLDALATQRATCDPPPRSEPQDEGDAEVAPDLDRILQTRAIDLSAPVEQPDLHASETSTYVRFEVANSLCGVSVHHAKEIVVPPAITSVPSTADHVLGVVNVRGVLMVVIGLAKFLRFSPTDDNDAPDPRLVVAEVHGISLGLWVDRMVDVCDVPRQDIHPPPMGLDDAAAEFVEAEFDISGEAACVISVPAIIATLDGSSRRSTPDQESPPRSVPSGD